MYQNIQILNKLTECKCPNFAGSVQLRRELYTPYLMFYFSQLVLVYNKPLLYYNNRLLLFLTNRIPFL